MKVYILELYLYWFNEHIFRKRCGTAHFLHVKKWSLKALDINNYYDYGIGKTVLSVLDFSTFDLKCEPRTTHTKNTKIVIGVFSVCERAFENNWTWFQYELFSVSTSHRSRTQNPFSIKMLHFFNFCLTTLMSLLSLYTWRGALQSRTNYKCNFLMDFLQRMILNDNCILLQFFHNNNFT